MLNVVNCYSLCYYFKIYYYGFAVLFCYKFTYIKNYNLLQNVRDNINSLNKLFNTKRSCYNMARIEGVMRKLGILYQYILKKNCNYTLEKTIRE